MREILLHLVFLGLIRLGSARNDVGLIPNGKGILLAESVAQRIQASCIFSDDKLLLRHIAYVETADGTDPETYRDGYHGGMWKVRKAKDFRISEHRHIDVKQTFQTTHQCRINSQESVLVCHHPQTSQANTSSPEIV